MSYFRPVFKKILKLKENSFYNYKILKFKRKKWKNFIITFRQQNLGKKFRKYKLIDQNKLSINLYSSKYGDYRNEYKHYFIYIKNFTVFYFNSLKKKIKIFKRKNKNFILNFFENRVDFILFRSKFGLTIRFIRKLISNNFVFINDKTINNKSFILCYGDFIDFSYYFKKYENNLVYCVKWPLPANNVMINYNIKKIVYLGHLKVVHFFSLFPYYLKLIYIFF